MESMTGKPSAVRMFAEIAREYHDRCRELFRRNLHRFVWVFLKYVFFGVLIFTLFYLRNTSITPAHYMVFYNILFLLFAVFSYLFELSSRKPGIFEGYELDIEEKKSAVSRVMRGLVGIISIPARGTIESFMELGNPMLGLTKNQFIFGIRIAHTLKKEIPLDFLHMIYHPLISREEFNRVLSFLKFMELVIFVPKDNRILIRPTKKLAMMQQRYELPSNQFPPLGDMDRLRGILSYLQERTIDMM